MSTSTKSTVDVTRVRARELTGASQELLLGGKPSTITGKIRTHEKDIRGAGALLDSAEMTLVQTSLNEDTIESLLPDDQKIARDILLMRCQVAGRDGDFQRVIECANLLLMVAQMKSEEDDSDNEERLQLLASALGYKGFSLAKMKCFADALPCLERSYELQVKAKGGEASIKAQSRRTTIAERQRRHEAITVERTLAMCCLKQGVDAPLPPLTKFPRTSHLFDAGGTAVSSDDLIISGDNALFRKIGDGQTQVVCEEKIDGANMGISLSSSGDVIVQNRSHYVNSGDHSQFCPLPAWIEEHRSALVKILTPPDHSNRAASQGLILFGEWMVAKHSISYHKLPGRFVAFDIYDRLQNKFYSRSRFHGVLRESGIPVVPVITVRTFGPYPAGTFTPCVRTSKKANALEIDLRSLLETRSAFRSDGGFVEGVVLRVEEHSAGEPQWLSERVKIVRPDFVSGCQGGHWMRRKIDMQVVDHVFARKYLSECYSLAPSANVDGISDEATAKNGGISVSYKDGESLSARESINPRRRLVVMDGADRCVLPRNVSWLWQDEVLVSSAPLESAQISAFKSAFNISLVITLTEEQPLPGNWFDATEGCESIFVPVPNDMPPSISQIDSITDQVARTVLGGSAVLIHCSGGKGRAGAVAACLLLRFGHVSGIRATIAEEETAMTRGGAKLSFDEAINHVRRHRPGSIETEAQEQFICQYARLLWKRASTTEESLKTGLALENDSKQDLELPPPSKAPERPTKQSKSELKAERERRVAKSRAQRRAPRCIILMGLPGAGKSSFAARFAASSQNEPNGNRGHDSWVVINQDRLGKRACLELAGRNAGSRHRVILDRCNITAAERAEWLEVFHSPPKGDVSLVHFTSDSETCIERVEARRGHETIPEGRGRRIVSNMSRRLEPPSKEEREKVFGSVHFVATFEEAEMLLRLWGVD